jgi:hypothetical protein
MLKFLALQGAPYIYDISSLRVKTDLSIRILFTFTGSFEGLTFLYDIAKSPLGDISEGGTESDQTETENDVRETGSGLGVTDSDVAENERAAEQGVPDTVLDGVDTVGEWHTVGDWDTVGEWDTGEWDTVGE